MATSTRTLSDSEGHLPSVTQLKRSETSEMDEDDVKVEFSLAKSRSKTELPGTSQTYWFP